MPYEKRVSGAQLPSAEELFDILAKESPRLALRYDFIEKNTQIFTTHKKISIRAESDDSWIDTYRGMDLPTLIKKINKNHQEIIEYIRSNSLKDNILENLYEDLVPEQNESETDAIFVFGAVSNARIERAIELYKRGVSKTIIISGDGPHYTTNDTPEARRMSETAKAAYIPSSALIIEDKSITIPDNVKRTIDLLTTIGFKPSTITLIATDFVLSRAKMDWYKFTPWDIKINVVAAHPQSSNFTKEGWYKDSKVIALVLNEYAKIVLEAKMDSIRSSKLAR